MQIEAATASDVHDLTRLLAAQLKDHGIPMARGRLLGFVESMLGTPDAGRFFLARDEAGVCRGVAYVSFAFPLELADKALWLEELYVEPEHRERGVGTLLLDRVIRLGTDSGCATVDLEVERGHERAANLYARKGFTAHTRTHWTLRLKPASSV